MASDIMVEIAKECMRGIEFSLYLSRGYLLLSSITHSSQTSRIITSSIISCLRLFSRINRRRSVATNSENDRFLEIVKNCDLFLEIAILKRVFLEKIVTSSERFCHEKTQQPGSPTKPARNARFSVFLLNLVRTTSYRSR